MSCCAHGQKFTFLLFCKAIIRRTSDLLNGQVLQQRIFFLSLYTNKRFDDPRGLFQLMWWVLACIWFSFWWMLLYNGCHFVFSIYKIKLVFLLNVHEDTITYFGTLKFHQFFNWSCHIGNRLANYSKNRIRLNTTNTMCL